MEGKPDLVLLDVRVPDDASGGHALAPEIHAAGYHCGPVLLLTARAPPRTGARAWAETTWSSLLIFRNCWPGCGRYCSGAARRGPAC